MCRSTLRSRPLVILTVAVGLLIPVNVALAEVHYFCPILAASTCGQLRARNVALLEQVSSQAGKNAIAQQTIAVFRSRVRSDALTGENVVDLAMAALTTPLSGISLRCHGQTH